MNLITLSPAYRTVWVLYLWLGDQSGRRKILNPDRLKLTLCHILVRAEGMVNTNIYPYIYIYVIAILTTYIHLAWILVEKRYVEIEI